MKNLNKDKKLEGTKPPGFFVGCPEQEFHLEMQENIARIIDNVDG